MGIERVCRAEQVGDLHVRHRYFAARVDIIDNQLNATFVSCRECLRSEIKLCRPAKAHGFAGAGKTVLYELDLEFGLKALSSRFVSRLRRDLNVSSTERAPDEEEGVFFRFPGGMSSSAICEDSPPGLSGRHP